MFKRSQKQVSDDSQHWYQDKYQHALTQRNMLALLSLIALAIAMVAVFTVLRLAPLKSVQPYLLQIDEKSGITQKVIPVTRNEYAANEAVDRYFTSMYIRVREAYNPTILLYNFNIVRLMSAATVFQDYRRQVDSSVEGSVAKLLGTNGRRDIKIRSIAYITNPAQRGRKVAQTNVKIMQARITTTDVVMGVADNEQQWVVTVSFEYATLNLNEQEQLFNPLGYQVTSYQIQRELN